MVLVRPFHGRNAGRDDRTAATIPGSSPASSTRNSPRRRVDGHPLFTGFIEAALKFAAGRACGGGGQPVKLCRFRCRHRAPFFSDRWPVRRRVRTTGASTPRASLKDICARAGYPFHLQILLRQGQPDIQTGATAGRAWKKACASWPEVRKQNARTGADRRARGYRYRRGGRGRGRAADAGIPVPANEFHHPRGAERACRSTSRKASFSAPWDMTNVVDKAEGRRKRPDHGL